MSVWSVFDEYLISTCWVFGGYLIPILPDLPTWTNKCVTVTFLIFVLKVCFFPFYPYDLPLGTKSQVVAEVHSVILCIIHLHYTFKIIHYFLFCSTAKKETAYKFLFKELWRNAYVKTKTKSQERENLTRRWYFTASNVHIFLKTRKVIRRYDELMLNITNKFLNTSLFWSNFWLFFCKIIVSNLEI